MANVLSHISLGVSNLERAVAFYDAALAPLGIQRVWISEQGAGYGAPNSEGLEQLALFVQKGFDGRLPAGPGFHLALIAPRREAVDAFHAAALRLGGMDNGAPGLRAHYGPSYYAAFVSDLDGHRLEAVHQ